MRRIFIIGTSGCGKTTLALRLAKILNIVSYDIDEYFWLKNWQHVSDEELKAKFTNIVEEPSWIISGNYTQVQSIILSRADTVIWLNYSIWLCALQAFKRSITNILIKQSMCNGNYETWKRLFSKKSIVVWVFTTYKKRKRRYVEMKNTKNNYQFIELKEHKDASTFLKNLYQFQKLN